MVVLSGEVTMIIYQAVYVLDVVSLYNQCQWPR